MKPHSISLLNLFALALLLTCNCARAAEFIEARLTANGSPVAGEGPNGVIITLGYDHEVISPRDPATGQATGVRQYKPLRIVKAIDKASPLIYKALITNQNCGLELRFFRKSAEGKREHYYTVTLTNARVSAVREWKPNTRDLSADRAGDLEEVSFVFQTITWFYVEGDVTFTDTWGAP